ncbi:MAG: phosphoadenylyl-sulfate reductase [Betaproteobacteria bacterium]|nr:phosphoadenylyl-sulfate reductase [Betaproteobacteria bacterium]
MTDVLHQRTDAARLLLRRIAREYAPAALSSSLGAEDMVLTDLIFTNGLVIDVFTLDTGRLPVETYTLLDTIAVRYGARLRVLFPRKESVESYVNDHGINGFYGSVELRKSCCHIRKVEPLRRGLAGKRAWVTGLRREQSVTRSELALESYDADYGLTKFNPLADWSHEEVWGYIRTHAVPYNALHDRGYLSIGCAPCTRAVAPGEDIRAGRWWWENPGSKECGLHARPDGGVVRAKEPA